VKEDSTACTIGNYPRIHDPPIVMDVASFSKTITVHFPQGKKFGRIAGFRVNHQPSNNIDRSLMGREVTREKSSAYFLPFLIRKIMTSF
jgi:hypothetical protein